MSHLTDSELELYSLKRVSDDSVLARIEEHLLVCEHCRKRLTAEDEFRDAMRAAGKEDASREKG